MRQKPIELKIAHNIGQIDPDPIQNFKEIIKFPRESKLPIPVFPYLIKEASNQPNIKELAPMGNDMELFHLLSVAKPKRSNSHYLSTNVPEDYPPKDGYKNSRQLNVIARAILVCKDLGILWKYIGEQRSEELIELGFDLTHVIGDSMQIFENSLSDVGGIFLESFVKIKERNLKKFGLWNFLNNHLGKIYDEGLNDEEAKKFSSRIEYQEEAFRKAMAEYMEYINESSNITNSANNEEDALDLKTFGANANTTRVAKGSYEATAIAMCLLNTITYNTYPMKLMNKSLDLCSN
ncbi:17563_t:CDS:2, partial [Acaulospora morrowiae]